MAKDSGVGGEALDAMAMETGHRFEKMDLTAVALAHLRGKISLIPADVKDDRIRSQGIIDAQRTIPLRRQPEAMLGQELILAPVAVIKGGEPPAKLPPRAERSWDHVSLPIKNTRRQAATPYVVDRTYGPRTRWVMASVRDIA